MTCDYESCQLGLEDCDDCGEGMGELKKDMNSIFVKKARLSRYVERFEAKRVGEAFSKDS